MNSNNNKYYTAGITIVILIIIAIGVYFTFHKNSTTTNISKNINTSEGIPVNSDVAQKNGTTTVKISNIKTKNTTPVSQPTLPKTTSIPVVEVPLPVGTDQFTVSLAGTSSIAVAQNLSDNGFITDQNSFITDAAKAKEVFTPGAYKLSKTMTSAQILAVLKGAPYMKWILIPEGLRKEEIATLLAKNLGWTDSLKQKFTTATNVNPDYTEGVYYPQTYLIPVAETPEDVANRLVSKFNENFSSLLPKFSEQNIKWTTGLTLASIVQSEAANDADTALIAGILWNRLNQDMPLDVDATLQYVRGNTGSGYWAPITVADKKTPSPYNTYLNTGLPPHPISNPGLPAIEAVLSPASTTCLYYIHDAHRVTHCATTYEEHMANIQKYL